MRFTNRRLAAISIGTLAIITIAWLAAYAGLDASIALPLAGTAATLAGAGTVIGTDPD